MINTERLGILLALFLLAACAPAPPPTLSPSPMAPSLPTLPQPQATTGQAPVLHIPRYELQLTVDPAAARVTGQQTIHYTNNAPEPLQELYLRLFPNTPGYGGEMAVGRLQLDGQLIVPSSELGGSALHLPLEPALPPGQSLTLNMHFTVTIPTVTAYGYGQLSTLHGVTALANIYPQIPVYHDQGWNVELAPTYGDAVTSEVALYTVHVTAPPTLTLLTSGTCFQSAGDTQTCTTGPMRDFVLVLGESFQQASQTVNGVTLNSFFYPAHEAEGRAALQMTVDAWTLFSTLFGPYPYDELDVVETPTRAGGIEYPGLVVIGERLYSEGTQLEWIVVHEVAHQWWYGLVGNDQVNEPWLDEALTQYSTLLYYEYLYGSDAAAGILEGFTSSHRSLIDADTDMPVGLPTAAYDIELYGPIVYQKGPLYFQALRERVGDDRFFAILQTYFNRHQYRVATGDDFLTAVQIVTGDPQLDLYQEWVLGGSGP